VTNRAASLWELATSHDRQQSSSKEEWEVMNGQRLAATNEDMHQSFATSGGEAWQQGERRWVAMRGVEATWVAMWVAVTREKNRRMNITTLAEWVFFV